MFGLCALLMAHITDHTIHCACEGEECDNEVPETFTADPQMLIELTNNFASILESLTKLDKPASINQFNAGLLNPLMAEAGQPQEIVQQPQRQAINFGPYVPPQGPYNPSQRPFIPQNGPQIPPQVDPTPIPLDARDCNDVAVQGKDNISPRDVSSGIYMLTPQIYPVSDTEQDVKAFAAYCDMETDGGNWTVFHRRQDAVVGFYRGWAEYKAGFGFLDGDHWLGLERLHQMTANNKYELRVDLEDFEGNRVFAQYDSFRIGDESTNYMLFLGAFQGTAKDSLSYHNLKPFTTKDKDNDGHTKGNCARDYKGAWWYGNCHYSNLNGLHQPSGVTNDVGMTWFAWKKRHISLKKAEMKIRRLG